MPILPSRGFAHPCKRDIFDATYEAAPRAAPARWYMVNKLGMATLCANEQDAERAAADAQAAWPHAGPHRAVQMLEVAAAPADRAAQPEAPGRWLVVNVGCIECGVSTALVGRFHSKELAEAVAKECALEHGWREGGQNNFEVFDLNAPCSSEYAEAIVRAAAAIGEAMP